MSAHTPHHHGHSTEDLDWDAMADHLEREAELRAPFVEEAVAWLRGLLLEGGIGPDTADRLLDLGSGPGVHTAARARFSTGPGRRRGRRVRASWNAPATARSGRACRRRMEIAAGPAPGGPGQLGSAELIWTSNVVHHLGDQQAALDALAARLRPGGAAGRRRTAVSRRASCRATSASADRACKPVWTRRTRSGSPPCAKGCPAIPATVEDWPAMLAAPASPPAGTRTFLTDLPRPWSARARAHLQRQAVRGAARSWGSGWTPTPAWRDVLDDDYAAGIRTDPDAHLTATSCMRGAATAFAVRVRPVQRGRSGVLSGRYPCRRRASPIDVARSGT